MKWITRERVKVDRVACPWLIKKFVDKNAEFVFVSTDKVMSEAERLGATPYDVKGVELGHHGKECSFDTFVLAGMRTHLFIEPKVRTFIEKEQILRSEQAMAVHDQRLRGLRRGCARVGCGFVADV